MKRTKAKSACWLEACRPLDIVDALGWAGALSILSAYAAASYGYLGAGDPLYQGLNLMGALGIVISSLPRKAYQATALNLVWAAVALIALVRMIFV